MKNFILTLLFTLQCLTNAHNDKKQLERIELPFYKQNEDLFFDLMIGTPAQKIQVSLHNFQTSNFLQIVKQDDGGEFVPRYSSTFQNETFSINYGSKFIGYRANEVVQIGSLTTNNVPFILQNSKYIHTAQVGFGLSDKRDSFWWQMMNQLESKQIVLAFESYPQNGQISLGVPSDDQRCFNDWKTVKLDQWKNDEDQQHFGAQISRIIVGNHKFEESKDYITFTLNEEPIQWPRNIYYYILGQLDSKDERTISCDSKKNITIEVQDWSFTLTPEDYIDTELKESRGECTLKGTPLPVVGSLNEITFPRSFFDRQCLMIDHEKERLAFATRRPNSLPVLETTLPNQLPANNDPTQKGGTRNDPKNGRHFSGINFIIMAILVKLTV